jgi:hypothetical protein
MDDVMVAQANVSVSQVGLLLENTAGLGTCKFNGEGYTCTRVTVTHPSQHTIENIQADAEVIAEFTNPSGKKLCMSSLVRTNSAQTDSTHFFNSFVGFGDATREYTTVNLGENWSLNMMVPPRGSYYVYDGSKVYPDCEQTKWVVFKAMINIDPNDFANLVRLNSPGSRPIQSLGDREVFFNDIETLAGGPMPRDGKTYMRCKPLGKKNTVKPVTAPDLKGEQAKTSSTLSGISKFFGDMYAQNEAMQVLDVILMIFALGLAVAAGWYSKNSNLVVAPLIFADQMGQYTRRMVEYILFTWIPSVIQKFIPSRVGATTAATTAASTFI